MLMLLFCSFIFHIADAVHSQSCILCCCTFYWTFMCIHNALGVPCIHIDVLIADESFHWLEVQFSIWIFYYCKFNFLLDSFSVNFVLNFLNVKFCFILKNFPKWKWLFFVVLKNDLLIIQCFFIDPNIFLNIWILNPEFEILFFTLFLYSSLYSSMLIMFKINLSVCQFVNVFVMFYFPFCLYTKCILYVKDWKFNFELVVCEFVVCMKLICINPTLKPMNEHLKHIKDLLFSIWMHWIV